MAHICAQIRTLALSLQADKPTPRGRRAPFPLRVLKSGPAGHMALFGFAQVGSHRFNQSPQMSSFRLEWIVLFRCRFSCWKHRKGRFDLMQSTAAVVKTKEPSATASPSFRVRISDHGPASDRWRRWRRGRGWVGPEGGGLLCQPAERGCRRLPCCLFSLPARDWAGTCLGLGHRASKGAVIGGSSPVRKGLGMRSDTSGPGSGDRTGLGPGPGASPAGRPARPASKVLQTMRRAFSAVRSDSPASRGVV